MKLLDNKIFLIFLLSFLFFVPPVLAGNISTSYKYAWGEKSGWINFGTTDGDVQVNDSSVIGYAWSENYGWINLHPSNNDGVHNTQRGDLSGYAWGESIGWIDFNEVSIDVDGYFVGYASSTVSGQISLNCSNTNSCETVNFKVQTDWRPSAVGCGNMCQAGITGSVSLTPTPTPSITPTPTPTLTPMPILPANPTSIDYQALINSLLKQLSDLQQQLANQQTKYQFTHNLQLGDSSEGVTQLQIFLKAQGTDIYPEGLVTGYFGNLTRLAVQRFQVKYGIANAGDAGYGYVGPLTRAKINALQ